MIYNVLIGEVFAVEADDAESAKKIANEYLSYLTDEELDVMKTEDVLEVR